MSISPTSAPPSILTKDALGPTDISPPSRVPPRVDVRVEIVGPHAIITSRDGSINERFPRGMLAKRFAPNESIAFFSASSKGNSDVIEIGDRLTVVKGGKW